MTTTLIIESHTEDPYLNLAIENFLLREYSESPILFLYVNAPSLIWGRFQNPWREINFRHLDKEILLVRRQSGGGCVYHDYGNLNYSIIWSKGMVPKQDNQTFLARSLEKMAIILEFGNRGDIYTDYQGEKRKISGAAFKQIKNRSFHHGTLLVDANLSRLQGALGGCGYKMQTKAIASIPHPVVNLQTVDASISMDIVKGVLKDQFQEQFGRAKRQVFNAQDIEDEPLIQDYAHHLRQDQWLWDETPKFHIEIPLGDSLLKCEVHKNIITAVNGEEFESLLGVNFHYWFIGLLSK